MDKSSFNGKPSEEAQIIKNAVNLLDSKDYEVMLIHIIFYRFYYKK